MTDFETAIWVAMSFLLGGLPGYDEIRNLSCEFVTHRQQTCLAKFSSWLVAQWRFGCRHTMADLLPLRSQVQNLRRPGNLILIGTRLYRPQCSRKEPTPVLDKDIEFEVVTTVKNFKLLLHPSANLLLQQFLDSLSPDALHLRLHVGCACRIHCQADQPPLFSDNQRRRFWALLQMD